MQRNKYSLSNFKLATMTMGNLYPVFWGEALPGDTWQQSTSAFVRCTPLVAPVMHPVKVRIHHWYVPLRLIWDDFEDFITGGDDGTSTPTAPYIGSVSSCTAGSLLDYLDVPVSAAFGHTEPMSALAMRAYSMIWNEHYRDQQLQTERTVDTTSGSDTTTDADIARVNWAKDRFTTARSEPLLGDDVTIAIGSEAPVTGIGKGGQTFGDGGVNVYETDGSGTEAYTSSALIADTNANRYFYAEEDPNNSGYPNIRADLSAATGVSLADLRLAYALQRSREARNRFGSRYVEYLKYLIGPGYSPSDARFQIPEYLGGGRSMIQFSEVLATDGANTGDLYGHGVGAMRTNRYRRFFEEHGIVMSLMSVVPIAVYQDGLHKKFSRTTKEMYFQKEFQLIGDEGILNKEIRLENSNPNEIFGYSDRYGSYRSCPSGVAGDFNSVSDSWHIARQFGSDPALNSAFIACNPRQDIFAASSNDTLNVMLNHSIQARRLLMYVP